MDLFDSDSEKDQTQENSSLQQPDQTMKETSNLQSFTIERKQLLRIPQYSNQNLQVESISSTEIDLEELKKSLNQGLKEFDLESGNELENEIKKKINEIQKLERDNKVNTALQRKKSLEKLQHLKNIHLKLSDFKQDDKCQYISDLQQQLENGLKDIDLESGDQLESEITAKKNEIQKLEELKKTETVQKRKKSLEKLENLQKIAQKLQSLMDDNEQRRLDILKQQLQQGLNDFDLQSGDQLESEIKRQKEEIQTLLASKRNNFAQQNQKQLEKLEKLFEIYQKLQTDYGDQKQSKLNELKQQLEQGLKDIELESSDQLENEISKIKEDILEFEKNKRTRLVKERKEFLEQVLKLQNIYQEIQKLQNQNKEEEEEEEEEEQKIECKQSELAQSTYSQIGQYETNQSQQIQNQISLKKLLEEQISLEEDILQYPQCAEKQILILLNQIINLLGNTPNNNDDNNKISQTKLSQQMEVIQRLLLAEDLMTENAKSFVSSIKYSINNFNLSEIQSYALQLLKFLRPLNIFELKRLIKKTEDSAKQIENKDILLLLGGTGAGKSTTIHFLAGSEMKMQQVTLPQGDILQYIGPVVEKIQDSNLQKIIVSPFSKSETRFLTAINLNTKNLGMLKNQTITICDTPGFGDTAGAEVDIANGIGVVQAIQGCKSVRPIILASNQSIGDRGEGIKTLARTLVGLIKNVEEYQYSFSYLYTKFNDKSIEGITALLRSIYMAIQNDPNENHDEQFVSLFENMAEKPGQKVDALKGKPSDCINYILKQKPIQNPDEVFTVSITEKSKEVLRDQLNLHKSSIISAIKRNDFLLIKHKLDDMYYLIKTLNQNQLKNIYEESVSYIKNNLNQNYKKITESFNRNLKKNNSLSIEDIKEYKKCIYEFKEIDQLRVSHLGNDLFQSESLIQNLKAIIQEINSELDENTIKEYNQQKNKFDNQRLLASEFPELEEQYNKLNQKIQQIQQQILNQAENALKSKNYQVFSENLSQINQQIAQYADHCNNDQLRIQYNNLIQLLINQLFQITKEADPILKNEFNKESQDKIKQIVQELVEVKETYELREHISVDKIQNVINNLNERIFKKFENLCKEINEILNSESQKSFKDIECRINQMKLIKDTQIHSEKIQEQFHQTTQSVFGKMQEIRRDAEMLLSVFHHSPQNVNYEKVFRCVKRLVDAQWMDGIREDSFNDIMKNIIDDLINHDCIISEQLLDTDLDIHNYKNIEKAWGYLSQIQAMRSFEEKIPQLQKYREIAEQKFQKSTSDVFSLIQKTFNLDSKAVHNQKQQLKKLQDIQNQYHNVPSLVKYLKENKIEDLNEFSKQFQELEDKVNQIQKDIPENKIDIDTDYEKQINELKLIKINLIDEIERNKNNHNKEKINQKSQLKQKNQLSQQKYQNTEDVQQDIEKFESMIEIQEKQKLLIANQEILQKQRSIIEGYQNLLQSEELKAEKEELLKKHEIESIRSLEKIIEKLQQEIMNTEKIDQEYIFGKLDGQLAEDALNYLEQCQKIRTLRDDARNLQQHHVNKFLKNYEENMSKKLNNNFVKIKSIVSDQKIIEAFQYSQQLASSLQEIMDISSYPKVFEIVKGRELLNQWKKNISQNLIDLREQMNQSTLNGQSVRVHLDIAKALTQLDFFINEENNYYQLYKSYQSKFTEGIRDIYKKIFNLINDCEFQKVAAELLGIDDNMNNKAMEQIRHNINITVKEILENTKRTSISLMLNNDLQIQNELNNIVKNLSKVNNAQKYVPQFLKEENGLENKEDLEQQCSLSRQQGIKVTSPQTKFWIDNDLEEIKGIIQDKITKYIESIMSLIKADDFEEAENKREKILQICQILGNICLDESLTKKVEELQQQIEDIVEKNAQEYINIDQDQYLLKQPKQILEKLEKVANRSSRYQQSLKEIKKNIHTKIIQKIRGLKEASSNDREELFLQIKQTLYFLPDDMKKYLEGELEQQKEAAKHTDDRYQQELADIQEDVKGLFKFREKCEKNNMDNFKTKINKNVVEKCKNYEKDIEENLNSLNFDAKKIIELSKNLNDYEENFKDIQEIQGMSVQIKNKIQFKINRQIDFIKQIPKLDKIDEIKNRFQMVATFYSLKQDSNITKDIDLKTEIKELFSEFYKYFKQIQEKLEQSLQKLSIQELREALDSLKKTNELFKEIQNSEIQFKEKDTENFQNEDFQQIVSCRNYEQSKDICSQKLKEVYEEVLSFDFQIGYENQKVEYYKSLDIKLKALEDAKQLKKHLPENFDKFFNDCFENIKKKVVSAMDSIKIMEQNNKDLTKEELEDLNCKYENMINFNKQTQVRKVKDIVDSNFQKIKIAIFDKVETYSKNIKESSEPKEIADSLIQMKRIAENICSIKNEVDTKIDDKLIKLRQEKRDGGKTIGLVAAILETEMYGIGQIILQEHNVFKGQSVSIFNQKTQKHGVDYVIEKINGTDLCTEKLKSLCEKIIQDFQKNIKDCLVQLERKDKSEETILNNLASKIKTYKKDAKLKNEVITWNGHIKEEIPELISLIFCLWSFQNISYYYDNSSQDSRDNFILQPHPGQIISILRMLGRGYKTADKGFFDRAVDFITKGKQDLKNNLIEIGTGEGKSITLAIATSILVILGADVLCACYSQYLSQRDYESFLPIFEILDLTKHISYGSFTKICEEIINEEGDIRNRVIEMIENKPIIQRDPTKKNNRPKILLIDEVDVFFSSQFFGNVYTPLACLKHETIQELITFLWKEKDNKLTYNQAKQSQAFQNCCKQFEGWQKLLEEALKDLMADLQNYEHKYEVADGRIGYKEQDGISFNISFGYKTLFAHYKEHEKGKITETTLKENTFIGIRCGSFSYAEIPYKFQNIMGVTGTLKNLTKYENKIVEEIYKIKHKTFIPSVFGENKRKFASKEDIYVENLDNFNKTLMEQINKKVGNRAILVFFENQEKLQSFYESSELQPLRHQVKLITEQVSSSLQEKNMLVKQSTTCGSISLISKVFGRGTDFICRDQTVVNNGGTHVISTFFSEEVSEEIQIFGRTARQGQDGSVSLVLLDSDLEKFLGSNYNQEIQQMRNQSNFYNKLNESRIKIADMRYQDIDNFVIEAKKEHENAENLVKCLNTGSEGKTKALQLLIQQNKGTAIFKNSNSRTICLMDATGSMGILLNKVKDTVQQMFIRASKVLAENNIEGDCFQMQFAVYRDYDSKVEGILQCSPWESKPDNLREFIKNVKAQGGGDYEEAIEIGLWHANQENSLNKISQVILIGDAPAKDLEAIKRDRMKYGKEEYWAKSKFSKMTHYKIELEKLKEQEIPVHCFYLDQIPKDNFEEISRITGGQCSKLDIDSTNGSEELTAVIVKSILNNIGGEVLVESYKKLFGSKSYS